MKQKIFMWFATGAYGDELWSGPHYHSDVKRIGKKPYHSLDDLLKMDITDSMKKKLQNAMPGRKIVLHNLHANGDLCLKCLTDDQVDALNKIKKLQDRANKVRSKLKSMDAQLKSMTSNIIKLRK